jgi:hypothetical protein
MQEEEDYLKFGVFYYGFMLTPDNTFRQEFNETCEQRGCYGVEVADVEALRTDFPLLVAKAGRDRIPQVNDSIDHFMSVAEAEGVPVTYLENPKGHHGFDTEDRNLEESGQIIAQTLDFMMHNFGIDEQAPATDAQGEAQGHEGSLVLHNGTVVTVNGDDPIPNAAVVVEDGLITAVGPEADMVFPEGATVIDVGGRTILPRTHQRTESSCSRRG